MIIINKNIQLQPILKKDIALLQNLMSVIYPAAYKHFWEDGGLFYINKQYSEENILKELSQEKCDYYFIVYKDEIVGNFRIIWNEKLTGFSIEKQVKLHRLYLHSNTQGKGLGKILLSWLENKAKEKEYDIIWLDAMNAQEQAFQFYKKRGYIYQSHTFLILN